MVGVAFEIEAVVQRRDHLGLAATSKAADQHEIALVDRRAGGFEKEVAQRLVAADHPWVVDAGVLLQPLLDDLRAQAAAEAIQVAVRVGFGEGFPGRQPFGLERPADQFVAKGDGGLLAVLLVAGADLLPLDVVHQRPVDSVGKGALVVLHRGAHIHQGDIVEKQFAVVLGVVAHYSTCTARLCRSTSFADRRQLQAEFRRHGEELRLAFRSHRHQQAAAGLRIAKQQLLHFRQWRDALAIAVEVAQCAARHAALLQVIFGTGQARYRGVLHACGELAAVGHFHQVAEQAETGDVGHRLDPRQPAEARAGPVQGAHPVTRHADVLGAQPGLLLGSGEDADAQRLGQVQPAAGLGGVVAFHEALLHHAGHGQAEDRLGGVDGVSAGQRDAGFLADLAAAGDHLAGDFRGQHVDRPAEDGDGHQRVAAHGVDIADGVGRGDTAEIEGVVDDRHEEIGGGDHPALLVEGVDSRVVARGVADPELRIEVLRAAAGEDHLQYLGRNLAAAAGAVAVLGQADRLAHRCTPVDVGKVPILAKPAPPPEDRSPRPAQRPARDSRI